jgi:LemA protein
MLCRVGDEFAAVHPAGPTMRGMSIDPFAIVAFVVVALVVGVLVWAVATHNRLVRRRNQVAASWAQVDVQLTRRYDLIPNLVETVKGYASHERDTLEAVTAARTRATHSASIADRAVAETALSQGLGRLVALAETYPDLKSDRGFARLQAELAETEDKIAYARQFYNTAVQGLRDATQSFPGSLVAGATGVRAPDYFQAPGAAHGPVQVTF